MRNKLFFCALIVGGTWCLIGAACGFPDVDFAPSGGGEGGSEGSLDGGADGPLEVGSDVFVLVDGSDPDADIVKDAGQKVDAAGCTTCDCDNDTFNDLGKAGCADAGGLNDCDDTDTTTRPDQTWTVKPPYAPRNGDWNCKDGVEKYYKVNVKCSSVAGGTACDALFGFEGNPACGASGSFVKCKTSGALPLLTKCIIDSQAIDPFPQACR